MGMRRLLRHFPSGHAGRLRAWAPRLHRHHRARQAQCHLAAGEGRGCIVKATLFLLMAQYDGKALIPLEQVRQDYFEHLSEDKLRRKVSLGEIKLPIVHTDASSQKSGRYVHLADLADLIDQRRVAAAKEVEQLSGKNRRAANDG